MAEQASLVREGVDRLSDAFHSIDDEFQRTQKRISITRRKVERRTKKELRRFKLEAKKSPLVKRADSFASDATKQLEQGIDSVLKILNLPTRSDIKRIDKRLSALSRRLKDIEKARKANGAPRDL